MSGTPSDEIARFAVRIDRDDVARFAAACGYSGTSGPFAPPTYPIRLLANSSAADHLRTLATREGGAPIHVSQTFDYVRRLKTDEEVEGRVLSRFEGEGARRQAILVLELLDTGGRQIGRMESRFVFARAPRE